jgi:hypothetical protein
MVTSDRSLPHFFTSNYLNHPYLTNQLYSIQNLFFTFTCKYFLNFLYLRFSQQILKFERIYAKVKEFSRTFCFDNGVLIFLSKLSTLVSFDIFSLHVQALCKSHYEAICFYSFLPFGFTFHANLSIIKTLLKPEMKGGIL